MSRLFINVKKNIRSYTYAIRGVLLMFQGENNFRIQLIAAVIAIALGIKLNISVMHWLFIISMISLVLMAETFNSALEKLIDHLHPDQHKQIGIVKDMSAGAVLIIALGSAIVGIIIFFQLFLIGQHKIRTFITTGF
jgi:diacylglycerol kinase